MSEFAISIIGDSPLCSSNKLTLLDGDQEISIPVTSFTQDMQASEFNRMTIDAIPRGIEALLQFAEENPLVVNIHWPTCPHCGKQYNSAAEEYSTIRGGESAQIPIRRENARKA